MQLDEAVLSQKYDIVKLSVISSTQISNRASTIIAKLSTPSTGAKPVIIALHAKSRAASKLISIAEIAKRELTANGVKCFQYNALTSELIEIERNTKKLTDDSAGAAGEAADDSDSAFQSMGAEFNSGPKERLMPLMTIYLSTVSIKELKNCYGEQR